jgi:hypothetical protein
VLLHLMAGSKEMMLRVPRVRLAVLGPEPRMSASNAMRREQAVLAHHPLHTAALKAGKFRKAVRSAPLRRAFHGTFDRPDSSTLNAILHGINSPPFAWCGTPGTCARKALMVARYKNMASANIVRLSGCS